MLGEIINAIKNYDPEAPAHEKLASFNTLLAHILDYVASLLGI